MGCQENRYSNLEENLTNEKAEIKGRDQGGDKTPTILLTASQHFFFTIKSTANRLLSNNVLGSEGSVFLSGIAP